MQQVLKRKGQSETEMLMLYFVIVLDLQMRSSNENSQETAFPLHNMQQKILKYSHREKQRNVKVTVITSSRPSSAGFHRKENNRA